MIASGSSTSRPASCLDPLGSPNIFHPIAVTNIPPATRTTGRVIPKNSRITEPNTIEPSSSQKLLSATPSANRLRCCGVHAEGKLKKIGGEARQRRREGWAARTGCFMARGARAALLTTRDAKTSLLVAIDLLALLV